MSDFLMIVAGCLLTLLAVVLPFIVSWGVIVFLLWLISLCFAVPFNLLYATGIWLFILLIKVIFGKVSSK